MVRRHISDDIKELALSMSLQGISDSEIRELMGVSERSLKRLRSTHRKTGVISSRSIDASWPCMLSAMAVQVRHTQEYAHYVMTVRLGLSFFFHLLSSPPLLPSLLYYGYISPRSL